MAPRVTGVCGTDKIDLVRSLGADHVIDYQATDYTKALERYDWILAVESHHSVLSTWRRVRPGGVFLTLGGGTQSLIAAMLVGTLLSRIGSRRTGMMLWWKPFAATDVDELTALIADGRVRPRIDRRFPLSETRAALQYVADGHPQGKVVITASEG